MTVSMLSACARARVPLHFEVSIVEGYFFRDLFIHYGHGDCRGVYTTLAFCRWNPLNPMPAWLIVEL